MPGVSPDCAAPAPIPVPAPPIRFVPTDKPFRTVREWLRSFGPVGSLLDVGCGSSPAVTWGAARRRYSIDPLNRPPLPDVISVQGLFPDDWPAHLQYVTVALCLDVLHEAHQPERLAADLLAIADRVIISIPISRSRYHPAIVDPLAVVKGWFGLRPVQFEFERTDPARLIVHFDRFRPVYGQRVADRDGVQYTFQGWTVKSGHRYARVKDPRGKHRQIAERLLRAA